MNSQLGFFDRKTNDIYRKLFCSLYEVSSTCLPFESIMHWYSVAKMVGLENLPIHKERAFVATGYFYGIHAPCPTSEELKEAEIQAEREGASWVMIPLLRRCEDDGTLAEHGYRRVPWFFESEYVIQNSVDADLVAQLGKHTAKNIDRLSRKAASEFDMGFHWVGERKPEDAVALQAFDTIHCENLRKYGHIRNTHGPLQMEILQSSSLASHLLICVHRNKQTGEEVQASLNLFSASDSYFMMLVQGIRRELVPAYHNLYLADTYLLYKYSESKSIRSFNLGRGGILGKARLGCNRFHVLDMHLKPLNLKANVDQLQTLSAATSMLLEKQRADVEAAITRGKYKFC